MPNSGNSVVGLPSRAILLLDVSLMLPLAVFTVPVKPVIPPIAVCNSAGVATWLAPVPNVITVGVPPATETLMVSPCDTAPCVNKLTGWKEFAPAPNPIAVSAVAVPPTVIDAMPVVPVRTRLPLPLSAAPTSRVPPVFAALIAATKSLTLSIPVDVYENGVLVPSLIVILSPKLMPNDESVVPAVKATEPVPVATASGCSVAPLPVITAAAGAPASGLASKSVPISIPELGALGRLA